MLLPGVSPDDDAPIKQLRLTRFTGEHWELVGWVFTGHAAASRLNGLNAVTMIMTGGVWPRGMLLAGTRLLQTCRPDSPVESYGLPAAIGHIQH